MITFRKNNTTRKQGFTLFEIMLGITIFGFLMIAVLQSVGNLTFVRIKTENRVKLIENLYFFSEKLVTSIKEGGSLDYEEYWNRNSYNTLVATGHYLLPSGVGNYGSGGIVGTSTYGGGVYLCRSGNVAGGGTRMGTGGCLTMNNDGNSAGTMSFSGIVQRYGEYALQYIDYNGNADADGVTPGDEDGDGYITDDEDDKDIGDGPIVLSGALTELYLYDPGTNTRTYFRWIVRTDTNAPVGTTCIFNGVNTGSGCVGNIQVLKLRGLDLGYDHSGTLSLANKAFDGNTDTWVCNVDWTCSGPDIGNGYGNLATGSDAEWVDIFPDTINVKSVQFTALPKKDPIRAWAAPDAAQGSSEISPFIHPYVRVQLTLGFAWGQRRQLKGDDPTIAVTTSISLLDQ